MSLLLNNYPPHFITKQIHHFFHISNAMPILTQLDKLRYHRLHETSLCQPTRRQKQLTMMMENPIEAPFVLQPKIWNADVMYPCYIHDSRLILHLPKQFYTWWKTYFAFPGSAVEHVKVQLVRDTNPNLEKFLIYKNPPREILTKMETI